MDPNTRALLMGAAGASSTEKIYVEDVFSTYLYTGNGSTQTITNGIDLAGKGGLVWIKNRNGTYGNALFDTARTAGYELATNTTSASTSVIGGVTSFGSSGFDLGGRNQVNGSTADTYASWTFRKAAKFFDVVTYTGNGSNRTIAHNLGSVPGTIIVKRTDTTGDWQVYHRSLANTEYIVLNSTAAKATGTTRWNSTTPTSAVFSLGTDATVNASGGTYVAYLFAHDAGGFGDSGNDNVVSCGSYTGTGANGNFVSLGWEPQWVLIKNTTVANNWLLYDNMRGIATGGNDALLFANVADAENASYDQIDCRPTGFTINSGNGWVNTSGVNYIYIAIRRGPMKTPTDATKVFGAQTANQAGTGLYVDTGTPLDMLMLMLRGGSTNNAITRARLTASNYLVTSSTAAEVSNTAPMWQTMSGAGSGSVGTDTTTIGWGFRRAPGFFDVVAWTASASTSITHGLGATPELIIAKSRSVAGESWTVYTQAGGRGNVLFLNTTNGNTGIADYWGTSGPTATTFGVAASGSSNNAGNMIAYLFATLPGVSKVFNYTGTGATKQIDCGFTNGARFVMIKRTDSTGDWYVWDSARGIISGNDPYLLLNSTAAEVTSTDYIDPYSAGFEISSTAPAAINANGGSYIGLAIA